MDPSGTGDTTCVVCSKTNPRSLGLEVHPAAEGEGVEATYTADEALQGPPGILHGGIQAALLDDVAVSAAHAATGGAVLTAGMEVRYRRPVPVGEPLRLAGRVEAREGRRATAVATLSVDGAVATEARFDLRVAGGDADA